MAYRKLDGYVVRISYVNGTEARRISIGVRPLDEALRQFRLWVRYYKENFGGIEKIELKHGNKIHAVERKFPIVSPTTGRFQIVKNHFYESHPLHPYVLVAPDGYRVVGHYYTLAEALNMKDRRNAEIGG